MAATLGTPRSSWILPSAIAGRVGSTNGAYPHAQGRTALMAKARDVEGRDQPWVRDKLERNYSVRHVLPVEVAIA